MLFLATCLFHCKSSTLFSKGIPHMKYEEKLRNTGLDTTALGRQWIRSAKQALEQPINIAPPFSAKAYFAAERPEAIAYRIPVKKRNRIKDQLQIRR